VAVVSDRDVVHGARPRDPHPLSRAGLVDPDPLSEDRGGELRREREQSFVPPLAHAIDPVAVQSSRPAVGGDAVAGIATRKQPPFRARALELRA